MSNGTDFPLGREQACPPFPADGHILSAAGKPLHRYSEFSIIIDLEHQFGILQKLANIVFVQRNAACGPGEDRVGIREVRGRRYRAEAETVDSAERGFCLPGTPTGRPALFGGRLVVSAALDLLLTVSRSPWIGLVAVGIFPVPVRAPFLHVTVHVVQPPGIRLFFPHG